MIQVLVEELGAAFVTVSDIAQLYHPTSLCFLREDYQKMKREGKLPFVSKDELQKLREERL